jgi:hypothetical protein
MIQEANMTTATTDDESEGLNLVCVLMLVMVGCSGRQGDKSERAEV